MLKFTELESLKFEAIHKALEDHGGQITATLKSLLSSEDRALKRLPWSYEYLESVMETDAYREWRATMRKIMMNHAEHSATVLVANTTGLNDQARASVAVNILKGNTDKAMQKALRGKKKDGSMKDPAADPANFSETAALLGADDDDDN